MTRRPFGRRGHSPRTAGQALVEFAFVAPIFFLLLLGIVEAGRFIYHYEMLNNAARAGVRYAIIHGAASGDATGPGSDDPTGAAIQQAISDAALSLVAAGDLTMETLDYVPSSNKRGSAVTIKVSYSYTPFVPILPLITITTEASGVVNN